MEKFVEMKKKSKKEQRRINNAKRNFWNMNPSTRIKGSGKAYSRSRNKEATRPFVNEDS